MIPKVELKAIALFASHDSSRYVLNGVCLEVSERGVILVATDGRRLGALKVSSTQDMSGLQSGEYILPREFLKRAIQGTGEISVTIEGKDVTIGEKNFKCSTALVEGNYPKWRDVTPNRKSVAVPQMCINAELLIPFCEAAKLLTKNGSIRMSFGGDNSPVVIRIPKRNDFLGVQMPTVDHEGDKPNPDWSIVPSVKKEEQQPLAVS